jgi:hypothetical protein
MRAAFPGLPSTGSSDGRQLSRVVNGILNGRINILLDIDIPAGASSVTVEDARISETTVFFSAIGSSINGYLIDTSGGKAVFMVTPPANAYTETVLILG